MALDAVLGQQTDIISTVVYFLMFFIFIYFAPKLMTTQAIWKLESDIAELEDLAVKTRKEITGSIRPKPSKEMEERTKMFMDFFAVTPVSLDPYGIVDKIENVVRRSNARFKMFAKELAPRYPEEEQANLGNALAGAMTTNQIAKILRHFLEQIKKYKMQQMALILQMQLPLIAKIAKASSKATHAFLEGIPIGDGAGPLVAATLMGKAKATVYKQDEFAVARARVDGRQVWIAKATGPGARTGFSGSALENLIKKYRIQRIITVDAALRMEGEKPGSLAEGVGVAMGGIGVERFKIEQVATSMDIPLDAVAIKMDEEEALSPMIKEVYGAIPGAIGLVKENIAMGKKGERVMIIGVGNTCGVGNDGRSAEKALARLKARRVPAEKKKRRWF